MKLTFTTFRDNYRIMEKKSDMTIAIVSFGHIDCIITLVKYLSQHINVNLYIVLTQNRKKESILNFEETKVNDGLLDDDLTEKIIGDKIKDYLQNRFKINIFVYNNLKFKNSKNLRLSYRLARVIKRSHCDLIHFNGNDLQQIWISVFTASIPKIYTVHDYIGHTGERGNKPERFNKFLMGSKNQKIVHTKYAIEDYKLPKKRVKCIHYGNLEIYRLWNKKTIDEQANTLLFFGRISPYKGIEYLIDAIPIIKKSIQNLKVIIAGEGEFYFDIKNIKGDKTYEIINRYIPNDELVELIQRASVIVCPYTDATQSGVVMTAYAFNKPVVASAVGGVPEVVEDNETGRLVPPKNAQALANAIIDLLSHPKKREQIKRNIEKKCSRGKLSWDYIARQTIEVYKKAIKSKEF